MSKVTPVLSRIGEAKFKQMVKPGDVITIEAEFKEKLSKFYFMKGKVFKEGKPVLTLECALAMVEEEGLNSMSFLNLEGKRYLVMGLLIARVWHGLSLKH